MPGCLFDTNVWVALNFAAHPAHRVAGEAFAAACERAPACFCRATEQSVLRVMTLASVQRAYDCENLTNRMAADVLLGLQASPRVLVLEAEPDGTRQLWLKLAAADTASPKVWLDAYLAAFAICGGLTLLSLDGGFEAFVPAGLEFRLVTVGRPGANP